LLKQAGRGASDCGDGDGKQMNVVDELCSISIASSTPAGGLMGMASTEPVCGKHSGEGLVGGVCLLGLKCCSGS